MHESSLEGPASPVRPSRDLLFLLGGLIATAQATNMIIIPLLPRFVQDALGATVIVVGFALGTTSTARFLTNIPAGVLADRVGRRWLLLAGVLGVGAFSSLSGTASSVPVFLAYRFLTGVFSSMTITIGNVVAADVSTVENRGRVLGLMQAVQLIAGLASPALGGVLADLVGIRTPFLVSGLGALLLGGWAILRLPETRPRRLRDTSKGGVAGGTNLGVRAGWRMLARNSNFLLVSLLGYATFFARTGGTLSLIPLFADQVVGLSAGYIGLLFSISSGLYSALVYPAGAIADRFGRKAVIFPAGVVVGVMLAILPFATTPLLFAVAFFVLNAGVGFGGQAPVAYLGDVAPAEVRGLAFGMYRTAGDFAGVIAPVASTALAQDVSFHSAFLLNAVLWTVALLLFARFAKETAGRRHARAVSRQESAATSE